VILLQQKPANATVWQRLINILCEALLFVNEILHTGIEI
jgi:hypothetical protein